MKALLGTVGCLKGFCLFHPYFGVCKTYVTVDYSTNVTVSSYLVQG